MSEAGCGSDKEHPVPNFGILEIDLGDLFESGFGKSASTGVSSVRGCAPTGISMVWFADLQALREVSSQASTSE